MKQGQVDSLGSKSHFKKWIKNTFKIELTYMLGEKPNLINVGLIKKVKIILLKIWIRAKY